MEEDENNDKVLNILDEMFKKNIDKKETVKDDDFEITIEEDNKKADESIKHFFGEDISNSLNKPKKRRGRPKGSIKINRKKVVNQKLTISLSKEEKDILEKAALKDDRSVSSFIKIKLKEVGVLPRQ